MYQNATAQAYHDPHIARYEHDAGGYVHGSHAAYHNVCCTRDNHDLSRIHLPRRTGRYGISNDDASVHNDRGAGHDHLWHAGSRLHHHARPDDLCAGPA